MKIKVLFDAHMVSENEGGNERYAKNMISSLENRKNLEIFGLSSNKNMENKYIRRWWAGNNIIRLGFGLSILARKMKMNIIHGTYHIPIFSKTKRVVTIHDLLFMRKPEYFSIYENLLFRIAMPASVKISEAIIVPSKFSRNELLHFFPNIRASKVHVVGEHADDVFYKKSKKQTMLSVEKNLKINKPYILTFNSKNKKKNIKSVLRAYKKTKKINPSTHMVVVGGDWNVGSRSEWEKIDVIFSPHLSDEVLSDVYNSAEATVYFSKYEGFGLPLVESIACGTEVVASNIPVHKEVVGKAAHYVSLGDEEALSIKMNKAFNGRLKAKKHLFSKSGSWAVSAKKTQKVYEYVLGIK